MHTLKKQKPINLLKLIPLHFRLIYVFAVVTIFFTESVTLISSAYSEDYKENQVQENIETYFQNIILYSPFVQITKKNILHGEIWLKRSIEKKIAFCEIRYYKTEEDFKNKKIFERLVVNNNRLYLIDEDGSKSSYSISDHPASLLLQVPIPWDNFEIESVKKNNTGNILVTIQKDDIIFALKFSSYNTGSFENFLGWFIKEPAGATFDIVFDKELLRIGDESYFNEKNLFKE